MIGPNVRIDESERASVRGRHSSSNRDRDSEDDDEELDEEEEEEEEDEDGGENLSVSSTIIASSFAAETEPALGVEDGRGAKDLAGKDEDKEKGEGEEEGGQDGSNITRGGAANAPSSGTTMPTAGKSQKTGRSRQISEERAKAMEFSRALYALEPLDRFPDDEEVRACDGWMDGCALGDDKVCFI